LTFHDQAVVATVMIMFAAVMLRLSFLTGRR